MCFVFVWRVCGLQLVFVKSCGSANPLGLEPRACTELVSQFFQTGPSALRYPQHLQGQDITTKRYSKITSNAFNIMYYQNNKESLNCLISIQTCWLTTNIYTAINKKKYNTWSKIMIDTINKYWPSVLI